MPGPIIQSSDLENTFKALRNRDPLKLQRQEVPYHPDYPSIPRQNYPSATSVSGAFPNSMTRFASNQAGIVYGQPQFFSPVHTPINWQIPSKRIEIYQWCVDPYTNITCEDFRRKPICELVEGEKVVTHTGKIEKIKKILTRDVNEDIYKVFIQSEEHPLNITGNHTVYAVRSEDVDCYYKLKNKRPQKCTNLFYKICSTYKKNKNNCPHKIDDLKIQDVKADALKENDYLVYPIKKENGKLNKEININRARLLGYYMAEGSVWVNEKISSYQTKFTLNINEKDTIAKEIIELVKKEFNYTPHCYNYPSRPNTLSVVCYNKEISSFFSKYCIGKAVNKYFKEEVLYWPEKLQKNLVACYFLGDGHFRKKSGEIVEASVASASYDLLCQTKHMLAILQIGSTKISSRINKTFNKEFVCYSLSISGSSAKKIKEELKFIECGSNEYQSKNSCLIVDGYLLKRINFIKKHHYKGMVYNLEVEKDHSYIANGVAVHNCRFFYDNEPKVASSIDFYSSFPMNDYEHECKDRKVKAHFDKLKKRLELSKWTRLMSHEIHLLGDCFPFIEISCEHCGGSGRVGDEICEHEGGTVRRIVILNPDYVEVYTPPLNPEPVIALKPDDELITMVQKRTPGYERLTEEIRKLVTAGQPIRLDNRNVSHLKYGEGGYQTYGIGMVRRLFQVLSYKTKLMVAQWIVAERLIVPIRIVKVGSDSRPAGPADIATVQSQLAQTQNDPNLTIVTHHAFELDWFGAAGKVLTLSNEFEFINQEILDGMMINNALLNGEGPCYHPDVEILTENGWKFYHEVEDDEKLATFNPLLKSLEYQDYLNKVVKHYDGEMVQFRTNKVEMLTTTNHRMYVQERTSKDGQEAYSDWKVVSAEDVKYRSKFRASVDDWSGEIPEEYKNGVYVGDNHIEDLEYFVALVGYYISEGWANQKQAGIGQKTTSASTGRIRDVLQASKIHYNEIPQKNGMTLFNFRKNIALWFCENIPGKAKAKRIPKWIRNLPKPFLAILLEALIDGDGCIHNKSFNCPYKSYITGSKNLADDVMEIAIKLGYAPIISYAREEDDIYVVNIPSSDIGKFPTMDTLIFGNKSKDRRKCITKIPYKGIVWCFEVPNEFLIVRLHGKVLIAGNTFSNAAVGIEAMIERLETFRREIANWIEEKIYLPEAIRQGFVEKDKDTGEEEYIYPKIKWNSMHLRDQQQYRNFVLQLYEKGLLSAQTVLEAFDFDPDQEIERKRYDAIQMMAVGAGMGQMGGGFGGGGMPGMGGEMGGGFGGGGMPGMGGDMGGAPMAPGGDGGAPGGAPISPAAGAGGAAPAMASSRTELTAVANPSEYGGKVLKEKTRKRLDSEKQKIYKERQMSPQGKPGETRDEKGRIIFTGPERKLISALNKDQEQGLIRYPIIPQFRVQYGSREYPLDFAIPHLKIGIEADGEVFHSSPKQQVHDTERDRKLNQLGWTIIRFKDSEIDEKMEQVMSTVRKTVMQKEMTLKKQ